MANFNKRVSENVPGEFFVDSTCMDCDTCRQLAPATFGETSAYTVVHTQPQTTEATRQALLAEQSWRDYAEPTLVYGATQAGREGISCRVEEGCIGEVNV